MAAEPIQGLRYPAGGDEPDGPAAVKNLADDVVKLTNMQFASEAAADATLVGSSAPVDGMERFTGSGATGIKWLRHNGQWVRIYTDTTPVAVTPQGGVTGTAWISRSGPYAQVRYDLSGSISSDTIILQLPSWATAQTIMPVTEYQYGTSGNRPGYHNGPSAQIRIPQQTGTTRRIGHLFWLVG